MPERASVPSVEDLIAAGANQATIQVLEEQGLVKKNPYSEKVYKVKGRITWEKAEEANKLLAKIGLELVPWRG